MKQEEQKILKAIGKTIEEKRTNLHMSKYRLSQLSGVQATHITLIEQGLINPTLGTLDALAKALKLTIEINK